MTSNRQVQDSPTSSPSAGGDALAQRIAADGLKYSVIGECLDVGFLSLDATGCVTYANDAVCRLLETSRLDLVGRELTAWVGLDSTFFQRVSSGDATPTPVNLHGALALRLWPFPNFDAHGAFVGCFVVVRRVSSGLPALPRSGGVSEARALAGVIDGEAIAVTALSPREREVLEALLDGQTFDEIAHSFGISPHTVRNHMKRIYRKLGIRSEADLLRRFLTRSRASS